MNGQLETFLLELGEPAYRARQAAEAKRRGASDWDGVTSWPRALRELVGESLDLWAVVPEADAASRDGTVKWALRAGDGARIETVSIAHARGRRTVCVSSQVGCALGCRFCATGTAWRGARSHGRGDRGPGALAATAAERDAAHVSNVVFMGMGEPLQNLDAVLEACRRDHDPAVWVFHAPQFAISTAGWVPGIAALRNTRFRFAWRSRFTRPTTTPVSELMPINNRYPIANLLAACRRYCDTTGRRIFIEYLLLDGVNDSPATQAASPTLVRDGRFHVNLIEYNPTEGPHRGSSSTRRESFIIALEKAGVTPVRAPLPRRRHRRRVRAAGPPGHGPPHRGPPKPEIAPARLAIVTERPRRRQWWCGAAHSPWWQWHSGASAYVSQNAEQ